MGRLYIIYYRNIYTIHVLVHTYIHMHARIHTHMYMHMQMEVGGVLQLIITDRSSLPCSFMVIIAWLNYG